MVGGSWESHPEDINHHESHEDLAHSQWGFTGWNLQEAEDPEALALRPEPHLEPERKFPDLN